jgi:hypothetical protein
VGSVISMAVVFNVEGSSVFAEAVDENEHGFVLLSDSVVSRILCPDLHTDGRLSCGWPGGLATASPQCPSGDNEGSACC